MKINEIILEGSAPGGGGSTKAISKTHKVGLSNALTSPDLNMNSGSLYLNYRFSVALAGSPDQTMDKDNYIAGDPFYAPYADEELETLYHAAKQIGIKFDHNWASNKSELDSVNKTSPVKSAGPIVLRRK
jgi:hypothetical protein